jgi:hypothetical protein
MLRIEYNPASSRSHRPSTLKSLQLDINNHRRARVSAVSGGDSKARNTDAGVLISLTELPKRVVITDMVRAYKLDIVVCMLSSCMSCHICDAFI